MADDDLQDLDQETEELLRRQPARQARTRGYRGPGSGSGFHAFGLALHNLLTGNSARQQEQTRLQIDQQLRVLKERRQQILDQQREQREQDRAEREQRTQQREERNQARQEREDQRNELERTIKAHENYASALADEKKWGDAKRDLQRQIDGTAPASPKMAELKSQLLEAKQELSRATRAREARDVQLAPLLKAAKEEAVLPARPGGELPRTTSVFGESYVPSRPPPGSLSRPKEEDFLKTYRGDVGADVAVGRKSYPQLEEAERKAGGSVQGLEGQISATRNQDIEKARKDLAEAQRNYDAAVRKRGAAEQMGGGEPGTTVAPRSPAPATSGSETSPMFRPQSGQGQGLGPYHPMAGQWSDVGVNVRGLKNMNLGNIGYGDWARAHGATGSAGYDTGHGVAVFPSYQAGYDAARDLALAKYRSGMTTPLSIIAGQRGWTPGNREAAVNIARTMGIGPQSDLGLSSPANVGSFLRALGRQELGPAGSSSYFSRLGQPGAAPMPISGRANDILGMGAPPPLTPIAPQATKLPMFAQPPAPQMTTQGMPMAGAVGGKGMTPIGPSASVPTMAQAPPVPMPQQQPNQIGAINNQILDLMRRQQSAGTQQAGGSGQDGGQGQQGQQPTDIGGGASVPSISRSQGMVPKYQNKLAPAPLPAKLYAPDSGMMAQARRAIAMGAPRDAVMRRMMENSLDPAGL